MKSFEAPDASNHTFRFPAGIKFHNGREMTSEDVKLNIERIGATEGAWLKSVADRVQSIVRGRSSSQLSEPYSPMLSPISELWMMAPGSPGWDAAITTPIGTGPFVWKESISDDKIVLEAFPDCWRAGQPYSIEVLNLEGDSTTALLAGDVHVTGVGRDQKELVGNDPDVELQQENATSWQFLLTNRNPQPPNNDIRVRQGIGHALDKTALNEFSNGETRARSPTRWRPLDRSAGPPTSSIPSALKCIGCSIYSPHS